MTKVNWRDMETEELGSVYESLLELTPELNLEAREFTFAEGDATKGNARKVSGSYYTPDSLVKLLLDTTLDPVLDAAEARNPNDPVSEILKLSMIDPACGSGHFLLGAARRAAGRRTAGPSSALSPYHLSLAASTANARARNAARRGASLSRWTLTSCTTRGKRRWREKIRRFLSSWRSRRLSTMPTSCKRSKPFCFGERAYYDITVHSVTVYQNTRSPSATV